MEMVCGGALRASALDFRSWVPAVVAETSWLCDVVDQSPLTSSGWFAELYKLWSLHLSTVVGE